VLACRSFRNSIDRYLLVDHTLGFYLATTGLVGRKFAEKAFGSTEGRGLLAQALRTGAALVTANVDEFTRVPGLQCWMMNLQPRRCTPTKGRWDSIRELEIGGTYVACGA
jgi:hypothetical protein